VARNKKTDVPDVADSPDAPGERQRLTPVDIQQKVFRLAFRGYNERDVDEFLDHVTEEVAALHEENKRLREQVAEPGGSGTDVAAANRQAEAIVRQAREHAARLVGDAERRATAAGASAGALSASFLLQERRFLQQMASLIQGHVGRLKEEAKRSRSGPEEAASDEAPLASEEDRERSAGAGPIAGASAAAAEAAGPVDGDAAPSTPERSDPGPPSPPEDATAPWSPVEEEESPPRTPPEGESEDPLVSAWESAFSADPGDSPSEERPRQKDREGEPSLRELFWGEE
jgi:DivIVA domain-containing protein